ncbi:MAG: hypothetical protein KGM96_12845 [Acidobacteriota bacterium]|nr:hypothetical protein [Acidobacteriota bacterium]
MKQLLKDFSQIGESRSNGTSRQPDTVERIDPPVQSMAVDLAWLLVTAAVAGLLCVAVNMWDRKNATVTIPFAFSANHQIVPAGCYRVRLASDRILSLVDIQTGVRLKFPMAHPEPGGSVETRGRLVFRVDGGRHVLTEVRIAGSRTRNKLSVQSSPGHEPAKRSPPEGAFTEIAMD